MTAIIDKRNTDYDGRAGLESADAGGAQKVNHYTGHVTEVIATGPESLAAEAASDAELIARAKEFAGSITESVGFAPGEPVEFEADPTVTRTSGAQRVVSLQQTLNGIEVWGMAPKVWLDDAGTVDRLVGDTVSVPADSTLRPTVSVGVALRVAAAEAAKSRTLATAFGEDELPELDISADEYPLLSSQPRNDRAATFARGSFEEDIPARLVYLYTGPSVRLTWMFTFSREHLVAQYRAFVEADEQTANQAEPEILYFYETSSRAISARVFRHNPDEGVMEQVSFPLPAAAYPVEAPTGLPVGFPLPWNAPVNGNISTQGNNTMAVNGTHPAAVRRRDGRWGRRVRRRGELPGTTGHQHLLLLQLPARLLLDARLRRRIGELPDRQRHRRRAGRGPGPCLRPSRRRCSGPRTWQRGPTACSR